MNLFIVETAAAALPDRITEGMPEVLVAVNTEDPTAQKQPESKIADANAAAAAISGSPWPGVIDHLLQTPLPDQHPSANSANIHINYPSLGHKYVDADIRSFVSGIASAFNSHLDASGLEKIGEHETTNDFGVFLQDDDLNSDEAWRSSKPESLFELWGNYSVSRPSRNAVSITFELWNYAGNNDGNLDIITLNYSLLTGQRLALADIFEKPETALQLMSEWSRKQLESRLGASGRSRMVFDGTMPLVENFSSITLTPEGLCINFQPYQVAPGDAGIQKVEMPLEKLQDAGPLLALWGK